MKVCDQIVSGDRPRPSRANCSSLQMSVWPIGYICSKLTWLAAHEDFILFSWYERASLKLSSLICTKYIFQLYTNKYFELKIIHINR